MHDLHLAPKLIRICFFLYVGCLGVFTLLASGDLIHEPAIRLVAPTLAKMSASCLIDLNLILASLLLSMIPFK